MNSFFSLVKLLIGGYFLTILAGCSGVESAYASATTPTLVSRSEPSLRAAAKSRSFADADANQTGAVIVGAFQNSVSIYSLIGKLVAEIDNLPGPTGLTVDTAGNLYIANTGNGILVYKNDYKTLLETLSDPYQSLGVAVDKATGLVAAFNIVVKGIGANVTFYLRGSSTPCANLTFNQLLNLYQGAFDKAGNLYVTGETSTGAPEIGVISGGCSANSIKILTTSNQYVKAYGIQVTSNGKVAIEDQGSRAIYTYNPPVNGAFGSPILTTPLSGSEGIEEFAFTKGEKSLFVTDSLLNKTLKYAYPAGGAPLNFIAPQQNPVGLAVSSSPP